MAAGGRGAFHEGADMEDNVCTTREPRILQQDATHIFEVARAAREHFQVRKTQALEPPGDGLKKLFEH